MSHFHVYFFIKKFFYLAHTILTHIFLHEIFHFDKTSTWRNVKTQIMMLIKKSLTLFKIFSFTSFFTKALRVRTICSKQWNTTKHNKKIYYRRRKEKQSNHKFMLTTISLGSKNELLSSSEHICHHSPITSNKSLNSLVP
jgi:hypothetical protein